MTLGVGFLGAGPVVQSIHLPTLARLSDLFHVASVMDVRAEVAEAVASRHGATATTSVEAVLSDPAVDVVAVCSPAPLHAEQVIAACRAGVRAVLCEKPFAISADEARGIADVARETGVPVLVGAMHGYDPAWLQIRGELAELERDAHTVRLTFAQPPNSRFEDFATEVIGRTPPRPIDLTDPEVVWDTVHGSVLGLFIHDLPLVRRFVPDVTGLVTAEALGPGGTLIVYAGEDRRVQLVSTPPTPWRPEWTFEAWSDDAALTIAFTPSYVHAGSGIARLERAGRPTVETRLTASNGYEGEWRVLARLAAGDAALAPDLDELVDDLAYAFAVADLAAASARADVQAGAR